MLMGLLEFPEDLIHTRAVCVQGGSIIYNSSFSAFNPMQPLAMYAVSKTALVSCQPCS